MDSSASALRSSLHGNFAGALPRAELLPHKPGVVPVQSYSPPSKKLYVQGFAARGIAPSRTRNAAVVSCLKTSEATGVAKSSEGNTRDSKDKTTSPRATFPSAFEELLLEVCDETQIAELKLKIGDIEMQVKRNLGATKEAFASIPSPTTPPPIPTEPMENSGAVVPPPKPSPEKTSPFTNVSFGKSSKLAALEAPGSSGYVLVSSPTVGSFRRGRTLKGKKQPPSCKEGDVIKEGQVIGWLDQFGTELPVKSDVSGEVLKLLVNDGEPVGYGDPLIAVLPAFHSINIM
ncbi:hypothetical protein ACJRO7_003131 [Eucalyptus globulus]|uniref:Lipoyl-binding domain-containing protein n=1 Tax=Eucalyptus globulus TaxID=34317 RepID=A0ABD3ITF3_EUCGL